MSTGLLMLLAMASGVCFGSMGITYRIGQGRGVTPAHIFVVCSAVGAAFFMATGIPAAWLQAPGRVWVLGLMAGSTQYLSSRLVGAALRLGPLSPVWCTMNLLFVLPVVYAAAFLGEALTGWHWAAFAAAAACIVSASMGRKADGGGARLASSWGRKAAYGLLLAAMLVMGSASSVAAKDLGTNKLEGTVTYMDRYSSFFLFLLYISIVACGAGERLLRRRWGAPAGWSAALGGAAGVASILGMSAMAAYSSGPAAVTFPVMCVASILAVAIVSATVFREKPTSAWFCSVALGVMAVVLFGLGKAGS